MINPDFIARLITEDPDVTESRVSPLDCDLVYEHLLGIGHKLHDVLDVPGSPNGDYSREFALGLLDKLLEAIDHYGSFIVHSSSESAYKGILTRDFLAWLRDVSRNMPSYFGRRLKETGIVKDYLQIVATLMSLVSYDPAMALRILKKLRSDKKYFNQI